MTHQEVKNLQQELIVLINYLIANKCKNYHVNYGLDRNYEILSSAVKAIEKNVSKELIELETKALVKDQTFQINLLTEEEQLQHAELFKTYKEFMDEEDDIKLYFLDPIKTESVEIEYTYFLILKKFLKV